MLRFRTADFDVFRPHLGPQGALGSASVNIHRKLLPSDTFQLKYCGSFAIFQRYLHLALASILWRLGANLAAAEVAPEFNAIYSVPAGWHHLQHSNYFFESSYCVLPRTTTLLCCRLFLRGTRKVSRAMAKLAQ